MSKAIICRYNYTEITFRLGYGYIMVNANEMAKQYGAKPIQWMETQYYSDFVKALCEQKNLWEVVISEVIRDGTDDPEIWLHSDIAQEYAHYLSLRYLESRLDFWLWFKDEIRELSLVNILAYVCQN